jgi:hydrogenase maturation protease
MVMGEEEHLLVMGIGNVLLGDEGVGVRVIKELEKHEVPAHVTLLDGGTGGFHLLSYLLDYPKVILVDATLDGKPEGTISVLHPKFSHEFPRTLSAHDIGLKDLVESAALLGKLPEITLYTVSVNPEQSLTMELSDVIIQAAISLVKMILQELWKK